MIALLSGEPVLAGDRWVVIDVHGVGYQVQVTQPALQQLADTHETVKLLPIWQSARTRSPCTGSCTRANWRCSGS